jgi:uncharacterized protein (TIGR03435 family)
MTTHPTNSSSRNARIVAIGVLLAAGSASIFSITELRAQSPALSIPKFDVASIKPCNIADLPGGNGRGGAGGKIAWSPGRLNAGCQTLENLIREAYLRYADGKPLFAILPGRRVPAISDRVLSQPIVAADAPWLNTERYTIEAATEAAPGEEMTRGPMLQALLGDRFKLRLHRESREVPIYNLTVAVGGPRLAAAQPGSCVTAVEGAPPPRPPGLARPAAPSAMPCGLFIPDTRNDRIDMNGATLANFSRSLSAVFDRDVVDKTGLSGLFDIHLDIHQESRRPDSVPGQNEPPPGPDRAATLAALQAAIPKLGLKLEAGKGTGEFLVIDHVERPSEN